MNAGKSQVVTAAAILIACIAFADWAVGLDISLGILYILPMVLAAVVLTPLPIFCLAVICAILRSRFENPHPPIESVLRFAFAVVSYTTAALFVMVGIRSRREQALRIQAEEHLKTLVESSPAGILTLDAQGVVLAANNAANTQFGLGPHQTMEGRKISDYLPVLADALRVDSAGSPFRTSAQSQGRRASGEMFLADMWFSTYDTANGRRLAAIVIDSSEEMRDREEQNLRQLSMNSRIMASAMLHEVRNLCSAIAAVYSNLASRSAYNSSDELQSLEHLVQGLTRVASLDLRIREAEPVETVPVNEVLNDLRIIVEPSWDEVSGITRWELPDESSMALADRHALLQVFLNLAQNSLRAVRECPVRELVVSVSTSANRVSIRFEDSGCGVADPQLLFQPFQPGSDSTGLGLYISRALLRNFGGELRFEPREEGACFMVDLLRAEQRKN